MEVEINKICIEHKVRKRISRAIGKVQRGLGRD